MSALRARGHWVGCVALRPEFAPACNRLWTSPGRFNARRWLASIQEAVGDEAVDLVHYNAERAIRLSPFVRLHDTVATVATKYPSPPAGHALRTAIESCLTDLALRRVGRWLAVSPSTLTELTEAARVRAVRIGNGGFERSPQHFIRPVTDRVAFFGTMTPENGIADLLELARRCAARSPEQRGWRLCVAGSGPLATDVERLARELPRGVLAYLGPQADCGSLYRKASALIVPSSHAGMAPVVRRAASRGIPAIAYDAPALRDVVSDQRNGLLVNPDDGVDGLERALDGLFGDPARCARLGSAARADYEGAHRVELAIDKTIALLERTAGRAAAGDTAQRERLGRPASRPADDRTTVAHLAPNRVHAPSNRR